MLPSHKFCGVIRSTQSACASSSSRELCSSYSIITRSRTLARIFKEKEKNMQRINPVTQEYMEAFHQHMAASERLDNEAIVKLAVQQALGGFERPSEPQVSRRRRLVTCIGRVLLRQGRCLGRWLFSLVFNRRTRLTKAQQWEASATGPIIIDVCAESLDHPAQRLGQRPPILMLPRRHSQSDDPPSLRLLTDRPSNERSCDYE
jgi:hypothetical protein